MISAISAIKPWSCVTLYIERGAGEVDVSGARPRPVMKRAAARKCGQFCTDTLRNGGNPDANGTAGEEAMASIVPFISNAVFEQADIQVMSDAYNKAIEDIYSFGRPNKTVEAIIATRIITLTKGGERDPDRLCERALAACGFNLDRAR